MRVHGVPVRSRGQPPPLVYGHQPEVVRAKRMQHIEGGVRGGVRQRLGGATRSLHGVAGRLYVEKSQPTVLANGEAGDRVVAAVGSEQEAAIGREDDAAGTLEGVRGALLTTDRLEQAGTAAAC